MEYPAHRIGWDEKLCWFWASGAETTTEYGEFDGPKTPPVEDIATRIANFLFYNVA